MDSNDMLPPATPEEIAEAEANWTAAKQAVELAQAAEVVARTAYGELVSRRGPQQSLHDAVSDHFARDDEERARRATLIMNARAAQEATLGGPAPVSPPPPPSELDRALQSSKRRAAPSPRKD
jgi:hypothetical protein